MGANQIGRQNGRLFRPRLAERIWAIQAALISNTNVGPNLARIQKRKRHHPTMNFLRAVLGLVASVSWQGIGGRIAGGPHRVKSWLNSLKDTKRIAPPRLRRDEEANQRT